MTSSENHNINATIPMSSTNATAILTWTLKAPMPTARIDAGAASLNGILYVVGGRTSFSNVLATNEAYNPLTNRWSILKQMPYGVSRFGIAAVNGRVYVIGGLGAGATTLSSVEAYDPTTNTWSRRAEMPTPRFGLAATAVNGIIYAVGGLSVNNSALNTVEAYNPATNTWSAKAPMPTARLDLGVCSMIGMIYAVGGRRSGGGEQISAFRTVEMYNPGTNAWKEAPPMSIQRAYLGVGVIDNRLYAIGGTSILTIFGYSGMTSVEIFNPSTASWARGSSLPTPLTQSAVNVTDGSLFVAGGWSSTLKPPLNSLYAL